MCRKIFTLIFTTNFVDSLDFRTSREVFPIEVMSPEIPAPTMKHISSKSYALLAALPLAFLAIFYFYPLIKILTVSLTQDEAWGFGSLKRLITRGIYLRTLWFTTWQAVVSTILTLLLALPGAYIFARYQFWGKALLRSFTTVPFVLPTVVVAAAFYSLLGPRGLVNAGLMKWFHLTSPPVTIDQTIALILIAHVFYNYTVVLRIVGGYWSRLEPGLTESAKMLGASSGKAFFKVTLPLLSPAILAASLLVFIFCFSSFGVILILGGPRFATIEVEIYRQAIHLFNLPMAAVLSFVQILFTFALMWVYTRLQRSRSIALKPASRAVTQKKSRWGYGSIDTGRQCRIYDSFSGPPYVFPDNPVSDLRNRGITRILQKPL